MIPAADPGAGAAELHAELSAAFERVSISGRFLLGPEVTAFEREFRDYCGSAAA